MKINSIFLSINGEVTKLHQGSLCTFIRLQGCNLQCNYCDTSYAQSAKEGKRMTLPSIVKEVEKLGSSNITITGGEPLAQSKELLKLADLLKEKQYSVSVETNGSIYIPFSPSICWVADWKGPSSGMRSKMRIDNLQNLTNNDFLKFVIKDIRDFTDAVHVVREIYEERKFFQSFPTFAFSPVHKGLKPKTLVKWMLETDICRKTSTILNLQLHKIIDVV